MPSGRREREKNMALMDAVKTGRLLAQLRKEQGLKQREVAQALNVSNKTVSKWECGLGYPDASLWPRLSEIFKVDIAPLMAGEIPRNRPDAGNLSRLRFHVCPDCLNVLFSTGGASIFCCGRTLSPLNAVVDDNTPPISKRISDSEYYITIAHEMTRSHYLLFAAYIKNDRVQFTRMYPEQNAELRIPMEKGGKLYLYCIRHGLTVIRL